MLLGADRLLWAMLLVYQQISEESSWEILVIPFFMKNKWHLKLRRWHLISLIKCLQQLFCGTSHPPNITYLILLIMPSYVLDNYKSCYWSLPVVMIKTTAHYINKVSDQSLNYFVLQNHHTNWGWIWISCQMHISHP